MNINSIRRDTTKNLSVIDLSTFIIVGESRLALETLFY